MESHICKSSHSWKELSSHLICSCPPVQGFCKHWINMLLFSLILCDSLTTQCLTCDIGVPKIGNQGMSDELVKGNVLRIWGPACMLTSEYHQIVWHALRACFLWYSSPYQQEASLVELCCQILGSWSCWLGTWNQFLFQGSHSHQWNQLLGANRQEQAQGMVARVLIIAGF